MVERFRRYSADMIGHTDKTTDGQMDRRSKRFQYIKFLSFFFFFLKSAVRLYTQTGRFYPYVLVSVANV